MVLLTQSLRKWLWDNHADKLPLILLGHTELMTQEMWESYIEWCRTDDGRKYLKGGSEYCADDHNRKVEAALENDIGANADRCVCCGDVIPEGRQVCPACEAGDVRS